MNCGTIVYCTWRVAWTFCGEIFGCTGRLVERELRSDIWMYKASVFEGFVKRQLDVKGEWLTGIF